MIEIVEFASEVAAKRYRKAIHQALGKTYPQPGVRAGVQLPPGQGETVEYVRVLRSGGGYAVEMTPEIIAIQGRVERVDGQDVTIAVLPRREILQNETWERVP